MRFHRFSRLSCWFLVPREPGQTHGCLILVAAYESAASFVREHLQIVACLSAYCGPPVELIPACGEYLQGLRGFCSIITREQHGLPALREADFERVDLESSRSNHRDETS